MRPPVPLDRDHVRFSISYAIRKVLRRSLGRGDHEPLASKAADGVMEDFQLSGWEVHGRPAEAHSTPGPRPNAEEER